MWFCEIYLRDVCLAGAATDITGFNIGGTTMLEVIDGRRTHSVITNWTARREFRSNKLARYQFEERGGKTVETNSDDKQ